MAIILLFVIIVSAVVRNTAVWSRAPSSVSAVSTGKVMVMNVSFGHGFPGHSTRRWYRLLGLISILLNINSPVIHIMYIVAP